MAEFQFTEEQLAEFKEAFQFFDKNGDGHISLDELGTVMRSMHINPTNEELKDMIKSVDKNDNGMIEFEEFLAMMKKKQCENPIGEEQMIEAFKLFDKNCSNTISAGELRLIMEKLGERLTEEELNDMMREADTNNSGEIDYVEFVKIMSK